MARCLPGHGGMAIISALKRHSPDVMIILITASPMVAVEPSAQQAGVDAILPKPFLLEELNHVIQSLLPGAKSRA